MKIVKAMKQVARLQGEIKELKKRISKCLNTLEGKDFAEDYLTLMETLSEKTKKLITLKVQIMTTNIKGGKFSTIVNLGELKSRIDFLRELNPKSGVEDDHYSYDKDKKYKAQISLKQRNDLVQECQDAINALTDELDDFNALTSLESVEVEIRNI